MARRIDVELTSVRDDGSWTWRAAGAKQPKGVVEAALLYEGAKVGDIVKAEADFEIEGITITTVFPPKDKKRSEPERIEVVGTGRSDQGGVTSTLVPKSDRPRRDRDRDRDRDRGPRRDGDRGPRRDATAGPPGEGRARREGGPDRADRPARPRPEGGGRAAGPRADRPRTDAPRGERSDRPRPDRRERAPRPERPAPPKPKRLSPANVHRAAVLESLSPEQRPIAEQVLRGGIPAVRQAVEQQNATLRQAGEPEVRADPLVAMAEELLPRLKGADWRDRAEAAVKDVDEISIRDLRSVVAGADAVARDDETRLLASQLRQALDRRVEEQRTQWLGEITTCLDEGRLVRALRVSARTPDPTTKFPAELATRLSAAASEAMGPEAPADRWGTLLEAVAESPVRRSVKPAGLPSNPGEPLLQAARQASGRVPALAALLGIDMPPPPGPPRRPPKPPRPPVPPPAQPAQPDSAPQQTAAPVAVAAAVTAPPAASEQPADAEVELPSVAAEVVDSIGAEPAVPTDGNGDGEMPSDAEAELPVQD